MAPRKIAAKNRNVAPVISMVPVKLRAAVDRLSRREGVSISEVGRRAIAEFVERNVAEQQQEA
jgi:Ribbon-helix-helix protein, copG family